jgi:acyl-CoA reductase-like NAD-dependent aldehyde dehydrogenase
MITAINPSTEQPAGEYPEDSPGEIDSKLRAAEAGFIDWKHKSLVERIEPLRVLAGVLRDRRSEYAELMALEMGKPISVGEKEISKCSVVCEHFVQNSASALAPVELASGGGRGYVRYDPLGPVLAIMPWNLPFWQVIRMAIPAMVAGNVVLLKHAPNIPGCAAALQAAFDEAGYPRGVFTSLRIAENSIVQKVCADKAIRSIALTGSEKAGVHVAALGGALLKKTTMELGGSDPFIVLKDCDVPFTADAAVEARCDNSGQSCIAPKRFIVENAVLRPFLEGLIYAMKKRKLGDPTDPSNDMGPLARKDLMDNLQRQVDATIKAGAKLVVGGARVGSVGYFYPPTILANVTPGMVAFDEETFGPIVALTGVADADEAIRLANQTRFGLGASIWTRNLPVAEKLAAEIDAGSVFVNTAVRSDPRLPFGGVKNSGWGRELADWGLKEFTNAKTVWVTKA